jgi:hemerythrin
MPVVDKSSICIVEVDSMNQIHYEEADMLNELDALMQQREAGDASDEALEAKLDEFMAHMTAHFRGEEVQMQAINFPPYPIHKSEHDLQIEQARQTINAWKASHDLQPLADYLRVELPQWLEQHIATMDKITAHFFAMNGKEVSLDHKAEESPPGES